MNGETIADSNDTYQEYELQEHKNDRTMLFKSSSGERIFRCASSIFVQLPPQRSVLSTSWLNGGYREGLECVFNHTISFHGDEEELKGGSAESHLSLAAEELGFNPALSTGLLTAANMEKVSVVTHSFRGVEVTAVVTGGIDVNGGRAGDPASYFQENGRTRMVGGTINTILLIGANLPEYSLTRAVMTATEAKTVALQELMAHSRYSSGIATGSGTDMIAVIADRTSPFNLTDSGKHSKLGELIGRCVIEATKEALAKQSELNPLSQRNMFVRLERFGIDEKAIWKAAASMGGDCSKARFRESLKEMSTDPSLVSAASSVLHIVDEVSWGLMPENPGKKAAFSIMRGLPAMVGMKVEPPFDRLIKETDSILDNWIRVTAWIARNVEFGNPG
ncbi:MAG: adenosylcobinamide hydrolase [Methanolobus sp.]|nr:adenosylcobinamide hydrolase [Methanolobus sp.]MDK2834071.1 adenosylcobinamide hydrolase [Methanolobus sp.]